MEIKTELEKAGLGANGMHAVFIAWSDVGPVVRRGARYLDHFILLNRCSEILEAEYENFRKTADAEEFKFNGRLFEIYLCMKDGQTSIVLNVLQTCQMVMDSNDYDHFPDVFRHIACTVRMIGRVDSNFLNDRRFVNLVTSCAVKQSNNRGQSYALMCINGLLLQRHGNDHLSMVVPTMVRQLTQQCIVLFGKLKMDLSMDTRELSSVEILFHNMVGPYNIKCPNDYTLLVAIVGFFRAASSFRTGISSLFENETCIELILKMVKVCNKRWEARQVAYQCLQCLSNLLKNVKYATNFIINGGMPIIFETPIRSMCATSAAKCLTSISENGCCMELLEGNVSGDDMIRFLLCTISHGTSPAMKYVQSFMQSMFHYKRFLEYFENRDGIGILLNTISSMGIFNNLSDAPSRVNTTSVRALHSYPFRDLIAVVSAIKRYMIHKLYFMVETKQNRLLEQDGNIWDPSFQTLYSLHQRFLMDRTLSSWTPAERFVSCNGLMISMMAIVMMNVPSNTENRYSICDLLDILAIVCLDKRAKTLLAETYVKIEGEDSLAFLILFELCNSGGYFATRIKLGVLQLIANLVHSSNIESPHTQFILEKFRCGNGLGMVAKMFSENEPPNSPRINAMSALCLVRLSKDEYLAHLASFLDCCSFHFLAQRQLNAGHVQSFWNRELHCFTNMMIIRLSRCFHHFERDIQVERIKTDLRQLGLLQTLESLENETMQKKIPRANPIKSVLSVNLTGSFKFYPKFKPVGKLQSKSFGKKEISAFAYSTDGDTVYLTCGKSEIKLLRRRNFEHFHSIYTLHDQSIDLIEPSKDDNFLLYFSLCTNGLSCTVRDMINGTEIWSTTDDLTFAAFNNGSPEEVVATNYQDAIIYNTTTGKIIQKFSPKDKNGFEFNVATTNQNDTLLLSDAHLWDRKTNKLVHRFDKYSNYISGVFNPYFDFQIISESLIWDLRTFKILKNEANLKCSYVKFGPSPDFLFAAKLFDAIKSETDNYITILNNNSQDLSIIDTIELPCGKIQDFVVSSDGLELAVFGHKLPASDHEKVRKNCVEIFKMTNVQ